MKEIERLEEAVGKQLEDWTVDDLLVFSKEENKELLSFLKNTDIINECIARTVKNSEVNTTLSSLSIMNLIISAEEEGNDILIDVERKSITREEAESKCMSLTNANTTTYQKLVAYLILISGFDVDLKFKENEIKVCVANIKDLVTKLTEINVVTYYSLIESLLELIFPLRTRYYEKYNVDILDDKSGLFEITLNKIHDYEEKVLEQLSKLQDVTKESNEGVE